METQASPSLISIKQGDLRIVIDDFPDYQDDIIPTHQSKDPIQFIVGMIEEIRQVSKKKRVSGDLCEYYTCHFCRAVLEKKYLLHCTEKDCLRYFCLRCTNKRYNLTPEEIFEIMKLEDWSCFSCRGMCNCKICQDRFYDKVDMYPELLYAYENDKKRLEASPRLDNSETGEMVRSYHDRDDLDRTFKLNMQKQRRKARREAKLEKALKSQMRKQKNQTFGQDLSLPDCKIEEDAGIMYRSRREQIKKPKAADSKSNLNGQKAKFKDECHLCSIRLPAFQLANCSIKPCKTQFCVPCVQAIFQKDFRLDQYNPRFWACFSCVGSCKCLECLRRRKKEAKEKANEATADTKTAKSNRYSRRNNKSNNWMSDAPPIKKCLIMEDQHLDAKLEDSCYETERNDDFSIKKKAKNVIVLDRKDIDESKIISEINIDSACITLYDAENEEQLKHEIQKKLNTS